MTLKTVRVSDDRYSVYATLPTSRKNGRLPNLSGDGT